VTKEPVSDDLAAKIGVVAIGRNEGDRLKRCLASALGTGVRVVYVDSGSSDGSPEMADATGAHVIPLDMHDAFTAARARNEGFRRLRELAPNRPYVMFVDGDCEIADGWLAKALEFLEQRSDVAAACGRLRERHPEQSIYNTLCDIEWDTAVGETTECGGNAVVRSTAFEAAGGYRADLIAGEEPELCVRLRAAGWRIWRLDAEMAVHDASITRFGQWWKRSARTGYAFAQGAWLHGAGPQRHRVRESRSAWFWGLGLPALAVACTIAFGPAGAALLAAYPLQIVRLGLRGRRSTRENWWFAFFLVLGKFPQMVGQMRFLSRRVLGGTSRLIEYK
jgi:GT2 family glycosyltransferase